MLEDFAGAGLPGAVIPAGFYGGSQGGLILRYFLAPKDLPKILGEIDEADADPIEDGRIDLGELVAETMAIELDPYPRKPGAGFADIIEDAEKPSPFSALSKLKGED